ncbi:hypothetical protein ACH4TV_32270 [Streptomyces sp. NPDC020898]|uniref:hypothetical protein n=1 Tax=Streptomyces sp. NPDC020898 TaxID=3365101 RepID=UPI0037B67F53
MTWIDSLAIASDRHLYATANQVNRQPLFHEGKDLRRKPYLLVRLPIDAGPVRLAWPLRPASHGRLAAPGAHPALQRRPRPGH